MATELDMKNKKIRVATLLPAMGKKHCKYIATYQWQRKNAKILKRL